MVRRNKALQATHVALILMLLLFTGFQISAIAAENAGHQKHSANKYPADFKEALKSPDEVILYSLDGPMVTPDPAPAEPKFYTFKLIGQTPLTEKQIPVAIAAFESAAMNFVGMPAACFNPHHAMRVMHKKAIYDFVLCYECQQVMLIKNHKIVMVLGASGSQKALNALLTQNHVPLPQTQSDEALDAQKKANLAEEMSSIASMPPEIRPLWISDYMEYGTVSSKTFAKARTILKDKFPDRNQRILAMLTWAGASLHENKSMIPGHTEFACELLAAYSVPELEVAARSSPLTSQQQEGLSRLITWLIVDGHNPKEIEPLNKLAP